MRFVAEEWKVHMELGRIKDEGFVREEVERNDDWERRSEGQTKQDDVGKGNMIVASICV